VIKLVRPLLSEEWHFHFAVFSRFLPKF